MSDKPIMRRLQAVVEGTDHGASTRMATRLDAAALEQLYTRELRRCPGVTLDWLYLGNAGGLTLQMAKLLLDKE